MVEPVRFGISLGGFSSGVPGRDALVALAREAEAMGLDSVQVGDHVQWHAPIYESTTLMAMLAAVTERLRIASSVILVPLRDPVLLAKTIASLDVLSGGRVIFGVGVGGDNPAEYTAMRVPITERGTRANETLEIVRGLFAHERFSYKGRHFVLEDVGIAPRPLQSHLPLWVGGGSDAALRRAARYGDGWIGAFASERKFARLARALRGLLAEEGRAAASFTLGTYVFFHAGPDARRAREAAVRYLEHVYRIPGERVIDRHGVAGPVEACLEKVQAYVDAGARYIVLSPACGHQEWPRQLEACAEVVARVGRRTGGA